MLNQKEKLKTLKKYKKKKIEDLKKNRNSIDLSPNSKVDQMLQSYSSIPAELHKNLLFGTALEHQLKYNVEKIKSLREKPLLAKII